MYPTNRSNATVRLYTTGETQIEIIVTAEDGTAKTYTVTVSLRERGLVQTLRLSSPNAEWHYADPGI